MNWIIKKLYPFLLIVCLPIRAQAEICVTAYKDATLIPLRSPVLVGDPVRVCAEDRIYEAVLKQGLKFVPEDVNADVARDAKTIVELVSPQRRIIHLIRGGYYLSEFLDETLTNEGGHKSTISLTLLESPKKLIDQIGISELRFLYLTEDYQWGAQRVESVKRKHRPVSLSIDGKLVPGGEWTETTAYRRVITVNFVDERSNPIGIEHSMVETQYFDPARNADVFFRRFKLRNQKIRTVMQFIPTKEASTPAGYVEWFQNGESLKRIRVTDPGHDNFEVTVRITDGKAPPIY